MRNLFAQKKMRLCFFLFQLTDFMLFNYFMKKNTKYAIQLRSVYKSLSHQTKQLTFFEVV